MEKTGVILCGAAGKMGREIIRGLAAAEDLELVGAVDLINLGMDAGLLAGINPLGITVSADLERLLKESGAAVMVDFTSPLTVMENIYAALQHRVAAVVGTTGLTEADLIKIRHWVTQFRTGAIIAPNFAIGAILMMKMAQICARFMKAVEIVEMHHDRKMDAPSGTAVKTAQLIREVIEPSTPKEELEKYPGARGARVDGIPVHSIRLPGLVAHQEVVFGAEGQLLTLRHDAMSRECFIPGLLMAIRHAPGNKDLIYGMENLLEI